MMIKTLRPAVLLILAVFFIQTLSAEPAVMSLIRKKYHADAYVHSRFDLGIWWSIREREENRSGDLYLAPNDKFRLEMGDETIVSDGKLYWQYNRKSGQVVIKDMKEIDISSLPSQLLSTYLTKYSYTEKDKNSTETVLVWNEDSLSRSHYVSIQVNVETKSGTVKKLKLTDRNGNVNTYSFRRTVFAKVPEKVFKFEVPDDAQVFDSRE